jgi:hypothetical protein
MGDRPRGAELMEELAVGRRWLSGAGAPTLTYATSLRGGSSGFVRAAAMAKDPGAKLAAA